MVKKIRKFMKGRRGQGMTEYIIMVALIAIAAIGIYTLFGDQVRVITGGIVNALSDKPATTADVTVGTEDDAKTIGDFSE